MRQPEWISHATHKSLFYLSKGGVEKTVLGTHFPLVYENGTSAGDLFVNRRLLGPIRGARYLFICRMYEVDPSGGVIQRLGLESARIDGFDRKTWVSIEQTVGNKIPTI